MNYIVVAFVLFVALAECAPLLNADRPNIVPNQYIVVLHKNATVELRDAHIAILSPVAESILGSFNIGDLIGFTARLDKETLEAELNHPDVQYIEQDTIVTAFPYQSESPVAPAAVITQSGATWGIARVSTRTLPSGNVFRYNSTAGAQVTAFIIDTGIRITHSEFEGRAVWGANYADSQNTDCNGHGTHVAGTVGGRLYGVAKKVTLVAVKVLSCSGSGTNSGVINGINWVTTNRKPRSVANMSLGGGASSTLDSAVANSVAAGVVYAVAGGNDNANACNYSPARVSTAITAGATTSTDARSSFSNIGSCIDVFAPGSSITSAWHTSDTATNTISGTSMASPHVCGVTALQLGDFASTPAQVKSWVLSTSTPNVVTGPGSGSPNRLLYAPAV